MNKIITRSALAATTLALATASLLGCGSQEGSGPYEVPAGSAEVRERHHFSSLRDMVQASEVIVVGSVTSAKKGRTLGEGEGAIKVRDLTVKVETVLKGQRNVRTIHVEEEGYDNAGKPYSLNASRWANQGARAIFFLVKKTGESGEPYRLTNSQSRFFLDNGKAVPNTSKEQEEFEMELSRLSTEELIIEVRNTVG